VNNILNFAQAKATLRAELTNSWLANGTLKIYSGTRPATPDTAITSQVLLATFAFSDPAGTVTNGVWTVGTIEQAMVVVSGAAVWARAFDSTGTVIADCDVGVTGSGAMIEVSNISLVEGSYVSVSSFTLTEN